MLEGGEGIFLGMVHQRYKFDCPKKEAVLIYFLSIASYL